MSSAALSDDSPVDPDDELLVAYLDGELDRNTQTELETRLLDDQQLRSRLQQLQTGWEFLEELPGPTASMKLVESTLELAVADLVKESPKSESPWKRWRVPIAIAAFSSLAIVVAFAISQLRKSQAYQQQLRDLAIAEHLDAYNYGGDLTLIRQLQSNPNWLNVKAAAQEMGDFAIEPIAGLQAIAIEEREAAVTNLPIEKIDQLNSRWDRYNRLDKANRDRIRQTAEAVAKQPDSDLLLDTMQAYEIWRQTLQPELRDRIESSDPKVRREAIDEAIELTQLSISQRSRMKLDDETIDSIYFALQYILRRRINELQDQATIEAFERAKDLPDPELFTIARMVGGWGFPGRGPSSRRRGDRSSGPPGPSSRSFGSRLRQIDSDELEMVYGILPSEAQDLLAFVAGGDPLLRTMTLRNWAEETVRRKNPFRRQGDSTLLERYNEMDDAFRNAIDLLPPKEILNELAPDERRRFR